MIRGTDTNDRPITQRTPWWRRRGLVFAALAAAGCAAFAYPSVSRWAQADRSIDGSRLRLATVVRGDLERDVTVEGHAVAAYHPTLFSPARGLVRLEVQPGQPVTAGQLLAVVESPELASRLEQERSTLQSVRAELERLTLASRQLDLENAQEVDLLEVRRAAAERAMDRAQRTFDQGVTGAADYERAQDDLAVVELELDHARRKSELDRERTAFDVRNQELRLERQRLLTAELERQVAELEVRSPVAGLTSRVDVADRDAVTVGQPLLAVVDLSAFEIEIGVPQGFAAEVSIGTPAVVRLGAERFDAEVRRISPTVEGSVVPGRLAFVGEAPTGLKQSQRLTTRLVLEARRDVLKVQRGPFLESGGGHLAYVVDGSTARPRDIEVGALSVSEVEIRSGLEVGERVVISDTTRFDGADNVLIRP